MSRLEPEQLLEQPQGDAQVAVLLEESPPEATHEVIQRLRDQYTYDRMIAIRKASKIQRELSQAQHEIHRLERHLGRIEEFCEKNNVPLMSEA